MGMPQFSFNTGKKCYNTCFKVHQDLGGRVPEITLAREELFFLPSLLISLCFSSLPDSLLNWTLADSVLVSGVQGVTWITGIRRFAWCAFALSSLSTLILYEFQHADYTFPLPFLWTVPDFSFFKCCEVLPLLLKLYHVPCSCLAECFSNKNHTGLEDFCADKAFIFKQSLF